MPIILSSNIGLLPHAHPLPHPHPHPHPHSHPQPLDATAEFVWALCGLVDTKLRADWGEHGAPLRGASAPVFRHVVDQARVAVDRIFSVSNKSLFSGSSFLR